MVENLDPGRKEKPPPPNEGLRSVNMGEKEGGSEDRLKKGFIKLEPTPSPPLKRTKPFVKNEFWLFALLKGLNEDLKRSTPAFVPLNLD